MKAIMESIFGVYTPVVVSEVAADGSVVTKTLSGLAGVDWPYVGGVLLFAICLYSVFRLIGVIFK